MVLWFSGSVAPSACLRAGGNATGSLISCLVLGFLADRSGDGTVIRTEGLREIQVQVQVEYHHVVPPAGDEGLQFQIFNLTRTVDE